MAFIIDSLLKGLANRSAGKEQKRAGEEQANSQFQSDTKANENTEDTRQARARALMAGLGQLSGGQYAGLLGPDTSYLTNRRRNTAFKHAVVDPSKGAMWGAIGNAVGDIGNLGLAAATGGMTKLAGGAQPTSLRPTVMSAEEQLRKYGETF